MASISTYLAAIKSAIYGEEVRGSIHDAISAINDESEEAVSYASTAKDSAAASATAAANSATSAANSASAASASKSAAASSATSAANSATSAANSATSAANSMTAASSAKVSALAAQSAAESAATTAANSASSAAASESNAEKYTLILQEALSSVAGNLNTPVADTYCITEDLEDSDGGTILDSDGEVIQGQRLLVTVSSVLTLQAYVEYLLLKLADLETHAILDSSF